jgi:hypothetical protein
VERGVHKVPEGVTEIREIKDRMNRGRKFTDE